ncbi:MAG: metal-dependent hydrolase [Leptospiraceae bacterium]|nr:metal-dependent hydrolase [Leptospiraceae bacterium]
MPTIFSHGIAAVSAATLFNSKSEKIKFYVLVLICSCIPDLDVISFKFGISYSHWLGHRGITHSILFSILLPIPILFLFYRSVSFFSKEYIVLWIVFFISTVSHALLDALTNGGLGVCLYCPFKTERFFFDFRPILVSPIGKNFFSEAGIRVLKSEFVWIWIPSFLVFITFKIAKKLKSVSN